MYKLSLFFFTLLFTGASSFAVENVEKYYEEVNNTYISVSNLTLDYTTAAKHGGDLKAVEPKRLKVIAETKKAKQKLELLGKWEDQTELYDAVTHYYGKSLYMLENEYQTLLDLEAKKKEGISEMTVFLEKEKKIRDAYVEITVKASEACAAFSRVNNLNITASNESAITDLKKGSAAYDYYDQIYLVQFSCTHWEEQLMAAIEIKDISAIEKAGAEMLRLAEEGIAAVQGMGGFQGDDRVVAPTVQLLEFYKQEGKEHVPSIIAFYQAQKHFEDHAAEMKAKTSRTKEDVDNFNNEMRELKAKTELYNRENNKLNARRVYVVNVWNNEAKNFIDHNVPQ